MGWTCPNGIGAFDTPMPRRFQFSLRALLVLVAVACVLLGAWHLLETYGTTIAIERPQVGEPLHVKATYFRPFGPSECYLEVGYKVTEGMTDGFVKCQLAKSAERSWCCFYETEFDFDPIDYPCRVVVYLRRYDKMGLRVANHP